MLGLSYLAYATHINITEFLDVTRLIQEKIVN